MTLSLDKYLEYVYPATMTRIMYNWDGSESPFQPRFTVTNWPTSRYHGGAMRKLSAWRSAFHSAMTNDRQQDIP